jgi:hydrogenase maturation factor
MIDVDAGRFTVGVFQDVAWATKGLDALRRAGFASESLTIMAKESAETATLIEHALGSAGDRIEAANIGPVVARGPLVAVLQGSAGDLAKLGVAGTMRRVGFQAHDARIFEALTGRGGVLVAIHNEPRAADALAILHSYGGGNAAIGAWTGRV